MQRHLFFLRNIHRILVESFSYAILRICVASLIFMVLVISCGPAPKGQYYIPETVTAATERVPAESTHIQRSLPEAATVDLREMPYVRNVFRQPADVSKGGLDDFYASTRAKVQHIAVISNSSFDILKAFVAEGWAPIVMIQLQGRRPEILPVSAYNDQLSQVFLQNPVNMGERRVNYENFQMYWAASSRNKCVLITPQQLTEARVREMLGKYLPTEAFQRISVRSR